MTNDHPTEITTGARIYCTRNRSDPTRDHVDFGMKDAKGRAIGYRISRYLMTIVERPDSDAFGECCKPGDLGTWFMADTHATRNGVTYGALTRDLRARTAAELEELIAKRVAGARARYAKGGAS
jgi:hypothetical protein